MSDKDDIGKFFEEENKRREKQFGLEATLRQILWDGQVEDGYFNETFTGIVTLMKKCVENKDYKKQLYEVDLNDYKDEE